MSIFSLVKENGLNQAQTLPATGALLRPTRRLSFFPRILFTPRGQAKNHTSTLDDYLARRCRQVRHTR